MEILEFIYEFMKTGLFSIGGGLATLPFLYAMSDKTGWFTTGDISNMVAISESTPGPIGINMATYVGFTSFGLLGAILGPVALTIPAVIIIILISKALDRFKEALIIKDIFCGLRPASTALISAAGLQVGAIALLNMPEYKLTGRFTELINIKAIVLALIIYFALKKWKKHPVIYIAFAALAGIVLKMGS